MVVPVCHQKYFVVSRLRLAKERRSDPTDSPTPRTLVQMFFGAASMNAGDQQSAGGVAYFAHIGGFVAGMLLVVLLGGLRRPRRPAYSDSSRR